MPRLARFILEKVRARSGQAIVEFALIAPILLLLLFGIVEFARAWEARQVLTDAAREGARSAAIDDPTMTADSVIARVRTALRHGRLHGSEAEIVLTGFDAGVGTPVTVEVRYPFRTIFTPITKFMPGGQLTLRTQAVMRNE